MLETKVKSPLADLAPGDYRLEPERTSITVKVKGNWGLHTVKGTFTLQEGSFRLEESGALSNVSARIDAASFSSRNGRRDKHITSADFLDVERYPAISFASGATRSDGDDMVLTGQLTIHGVTEAIDVQLVKAGIVDGRARFEATAELDRTRFGITHMPRRVGRQVALAIDAGAAQL